ncbi:MAG: HAMP domain-containing protein, partial [Planctomycetes bacterium]|nr:HAMP domain-containing protein [Planctomycetota bacterium]
MTLRRTATVAVVAVSFLLLLLLVQLIRSGDTTRRLDRMSAQANGITATVSSLDHLVYEYLLQPHARPAQQWRLLSEQLGGQLDDLDAAGGDAAAVAGLRRERGEAHELFEALVDGIKGAGPDQAALAMRRSHIAEQMLLVSRAMSQEAARIHHLTIRQRATVQARDSLIAIGALAATFGLLAWLLMHVRRRVLLPLDALQRSTERVAAGNLDQQTGEARDDEIGDLARAFDRMVGQLRDSRRLLQAEEAKRAGEERQRQLI